MSHPPVAGDAQASHDPLHMGFSGTAPRAGLARSRAGGDTSSAVSLHDAMLAHELRNSLTPMKIWMYSICEAVATDPQLQRRCLLVAEEIDRLERLVKGYLEAARPGPATNRRQDVRVAIDTALALLHPRIETKQLGLHRDHSPGAALALVDLGHLTQVLVNLLGNAIDAVGDGSSIWITTGLDPRPDGERRVRIRIRDEGPGIATEVREHLFEPFVSTRPNGTGLGLAIVERIVTDLGGCVSVESTAGAGTTVTVWLPAADGE